MASSSNNHSTIVEVDGILFETLMPVQTIHVPRPGETVPVQLGVRITNQSSMPYRFNIPGFTPEVFDQNGQQVHSGVNSNARRRTKEEDVPLISPGEQVAFLVSIDLYRENEGYFYLKGDFPYGGIWSTARFQLGTYQLRLRYGFRLPQHSFIFHYGRTTLNNFWVGTVCTPLVKFQMIQS